MEGKSTKAQEGSKDVPMEKTDPRKDSIPVIISALLGWSGFSHLTADEKTELQLKATQSSIIGAARAKHLAGTKSWSCNCLLRIFFVLGPKAQMGKLPDFVQAFKQSSNEVKAQLAASVLGTDDSQRVVIEDSGYLTFIDMTKDDAPAKVDVKPSKPSAKQVAPVEPEDLKFKDYFEEHVPFNAANGLKRKYTVEIKKAVMDDECFAIWKKYELAVHNKKEKDRDSYERFLCQSPLYDPTDPVGQAIPYFEDDID